jgi:hypothetical protein
VEVETVLVEALSGFAPVVGLDRSTRFFGAGRAIVSDQDWERVVARLVPRAAAILILPGTSESLTFELSLLARENRLDSTIFFMPPSDDSGVDRWRLNWAEAAAVAAERSSLRLPPYTSRGSLFTVGSDGNVSASVSFPRTMTVQAVTAELRDLVDTARRHNASFLVEEPRSDMGLGFDAAGQLEDQLPSRSRRTHRS